MAASRSFLRRRTVLALLCMAASAPSANGAPGTQSFDADWRFFRGDADSAEAAEFDDSAWRELDAPHDWSIEGPFDRDAPTRRGGGYLPAGIGWYRKHFTLPAEDAGRRVFVEFDGVMAHSDVWINGEHAGHRPFGYASFRYDLTPHVRFGEDAENVVSVRADNSRQPASRWYAGAGIYRHVRLVVADPIRFAHGGIFVKTLEMGDHGATIEIGGDIVNDSDQPAPAGGRYTIFDPQGNQIHVSLGTGALIPAGRSFAAAQAMIIPNPQLWSPANPSLYAVVADIVEPGAAGAEPRWTEQKTIRFGIREFRFEPDTGFWLNGENMKIKGVCLHHDGGAVGSAVPKAVWRRRLVALKELGVNAIRTAHNPPAPEFLDLCDELGFLVMHEVFDCWNVGKNNADAGYQHDFRQWWERDLRDAVLRDRNHPSIILYSAGNEIRDNLRRPGGFEQFRAMKAIYDELDGTRPVTMAIFRPNQSGVYDSGFSELMDVVGQNYREGELVQAHRDKPTRKIVGTENGHDRGVWLMMRDNPFFAGQFLWTGIDYLGESDWPYTTWANAPIDRAGFIRPAGFQRQSWWSDQPMVHIARVESASGGVSGRGGGELVDHWTPRDVDTYDEAIVEVYSNCEEVELVLNGESLGVQPMPTDASPAEFRFPFDVGECEAIGRNDGEEVARHFVKSAGEPARLALTADRDAATADWDDVVHLTVEVVDADGVRCPWADPVVEFGIDGPGEIVAVDNGDPESHESFQDPRRRMFRGRGLVIVRRTADEGPVTITAKSSELESAAATINASAPPAR
jgi:beta-galactosidase